MNVFVAHRPGETAGLDLGDGLIQQHFNLGGFSSGQDTAQPDQAVHPGFLHPHFLPRQPLVDRDAVREVEQRVRLFIDLKDSAHLTCPARAMARALTASTRRKPSESV